MSQVSAQNVEEASTIAADFIYSIDNLPQEVAHLLQEIKFREVKAQELQQEIDKDSARYIRHAMRASSAASQPPTPGASPAPTPSRAPSPKSTALPGKIAAAYAQIHILSQEKVALAQRVIEVVHRTKARLDHELVKVRVLQGESAEGPVGGVGALAGLGGLGGLVPGAGTGSAADALASGRDPALKITESLRNVLAGAAVGQSVSAAASPAAGGSHGHGYSGSNKKRRIATPATKASPTKPPLPHSSSHHSSTSHKRRSSSPAHAAPPASAPAARSRLSRQIHPPQPEDADMDAEGEEDAEGEVDGGDGEGDAEADADEDERLYCFCQKHSYGDMIACDNDGCPYEWFHLSCVGMKQPLPDKWYCSACTAKGAGQPAGRKGRKK